MSVPGCGLVPDHHSQSPRRVDRQTLSRAYPPPGGHRVSVLAELPAVSCPMLPPLRGIAAPAGDQLQPWRRMEGTHQPVHRHSRSLGRYSSDGLNANASACPVVHVPCEAKSGCNVSHRRHSCRISAGLDRGGPKRNRARLYVTICGLYRLGSSRLAACTVNRSGMAANVKYTGDPQVGQKARVFTLPLSPTMSQCVALP